MQSRQMGHVQSRLTGIPVENLPYTKALPLSLATKPLRNFINLLSLIPVRCTIGFYAAKLRLFVLFGIGG